MSLIITISIIPSHIGDVRTSAILITFSILSSTSGIFPFFLCRQAELLASHAIQLRNKILAIIPTHFLYRKIIPLERRRITFHYCLPQNLGNFILTYIIVIGQNHLMDRVFITSLVLICLSHHKCSRLHFHHLDIDTVFHRNFNNLSYSSKR